MVREDKGMHADQIFNSCFFYSCDPVVSSFCAFQPWMCGHSAYDNEAHNSR